MLNAVKGCSVRFTDWPQSRMSPVAVPSNTIAKRSSTLCFPLGQLLVTVTTGFGRTHVFVADAELPLLPDVDGVSVTPTTTTAVLAVTVVVPANADVSVMVQLPVPLVVVHGFAVVNEPTPLKIANEICVPSGAFT